MKVVVYEPEPEARTLLCRRLRGAGFGVAPFAEARVAFLFLLGRVHEFDCALVNVSEGGEGPWLLERLALVREPLLVVTYREVAGSEPELRGFVNGTGERPALESPKMGA